MERDEIKKIGNIYLKQKTFLYLKEVIKDRENFYNGFLVKIYEDMIVFFDVIMEKEFPILNQNIVVLEPSKKRMDIQTAWDIFKKGENNGWKLNRE